MPSRSGRSGRTARCSTRCRSADAAHGRPPMTQLRPSNEPPVLLAVDERYIAHDDDVYQQALWSALGALDVACPAAIATLSADDLRLLADLGEQAAERSAARGEDAR